MSCVENVELGMVPSVTPNLSKKYLSMPSLLPGLSNVCPRGDSPSFVHSSVQACGSGRREHRLGLSFFVTG